MTISRISGAHMRRSIRKKGAVMRARYHRRCMMVSAIRMITETTLANSAPPESETIFEVRSADGAAPATVVP